MASPAAEAGGGNLRTRAPARSQLRSLLHPV